MPGDIHPFKLNSDGESANPGPDPVTVSFDMLLELLETEDEMKVVLEALCRQIVQAFPMATAAGITVLRETGSATVGTSDEVTRLEELQYRFGEGPSIHAARSGGVVRVDRAAVRERWPAYASSAERAGIHSHLSVPLLSGVEQSGALALYGVLPQAFHRMDESVLDPYLEAAAVEVRKARRHGEARGLIVQLGIAIRSRAAIDQAKGIVMALHGLDAATAFDVLVTHSQHENVKLHEVAERVVAAVTKFVPVRNGL
ncbi:GAF and ANTAR domain-containing protein [Rhodococcus marinonascens]|uniref:GAF and ANTAR domain-containing protein n=1 Tax=Rhodococcus marinonascens TaxID=38311 RepID=UPI000932CC11|nr:GAF and ANTAR domain-containing protein [Rhodococcus marinonascens]